MAREGNRSAQTQFYNASYKPIFNTSYRILKNKEEAEDVVHDTLINVFNKQQLWPTHQNWTAWIKRIAINKSIDRLKKTSRIQLSEEQDLKSNFNEDFTFESENTQKVEQIYKALMILPEHYRIVFSLFHIEGYDHTEISQILSIKESSSRSKLTRAKQLIIDHIQSNL
ncbi:MAG: RNA polymerase sigma factor [Bacteroidales bacterium]|nr:RNA polymerase sigma factor [Bacteroidales bacterium]